MDRKSMKIQSAYLPKWNSMNKLELIVGMTITKDQLSKSKDKNDINCMEIWLNSEIQMSNIENIEFYQGSNIGKTDNSMRKQFEKLIILDQDIYKQFSGDKNDTTTF